MLFCGLIKLYGVDQGLVEALRGVVGDAPLKKLVLATGAFHSSPMISLFNKHMAGRCALIGRPCQIQGSL